jgi:hypothetical protein
MLPVHGCDPRQEFYQIVVAVNSCRPAVADVPMYLSPLPLKSQGDFLSLATLLREECCLFSPTSDQFLGIDSLRDHSTGAAVWSTTFSSRVPIEILKHMAKPISTRRVGL